MKRLKNIAGLSVAAILGGFISLGAFTWFYQPNANQLVNQKDSVQTLLAKNTYRSEPSRKTTNVQPFSAPDFTSAAERSVHGVVHVKTVMEGEQYYQIDPFRYFFHGEREPQLKQGPKRAASGSGVLISDDGYIVTNNHVVEDADKIEVITNDNKSLKAKLIGRDPSTDLAVLKVESQNLSPLQYGNSDDLKLGEWVLAVGNPFNLNSTVTAGIVSAKGRNINILPPDERNKVAPIESFIQTDAAVNPGNSGGALVNANGQLVGINTAIKSPTGSYTGYSFAVPVNIVKKVVDDIVKYGAVQRGFIGVSIRNIDGELADKVELTTTEGAYVSALMEDGAAEDAGIEEGDVIVEVNGQKVKSVAELQEKIGRYRPGDKVNVKLIRDDELLEKQIELRNRFGNTELIEKREKDLVKVLGASFNEVDNELKEKLNIEGGVQITDINSGKIRSAGIKEGFIILKVDKKPIENREELNEILSNKEGGVLLEGIYPNGLRGYYGLGM
ncbi:Do family serine endopeptidase [Salibacter halophilus]|uniref:Do family serine endopeptidase n=1 Tax=Salibacter halophilus TaxID=1803916 RepID=A0A6N6MAU9_9FLAO|nr:Do family serine endopeptidase [Salibacter halophilus]KAB1066119.1 Do family serine endopeptidase [Salibacter halophilus]